MSNMPNKDKKNPPPTIRKKKRRGKRRPRTRYSKSSKKEYNSKQTDNQNCVVAAVHLTMSADADMVIADDADDNWLYGDSDNNVAGQGDQNEEKDTTQSPKPGAGADDGPNNAVPSQPEESLDDTPAPDDNDDAHFNDEHFEDGDQLELGELPDPDDQVDRGADDVNGDSQENGDSDSDDSEDDVKVILGDIKSTPQTYPSLNIKRGGLIAQPGVEKQKHTGKFSVDDFEAVGTINGVPAQEFNIDVLEDKPWRKPGADLTDYFNYGFNEDTWRAYCERQKRMRIHESGAGLIPLGGNSITGIQQPRHPTPILNDNSKYSVGFGGVRKAGPPPGRKLTGPIDVIGSRRDGSVPHDDNPDLPNKQNMQIPVRENTIQVMTADRREYSRNKPFPDMSLPPPGPMGPPPGDFFHAPDQQFYQPPYHQEEPWGNKSGWAPSDIKELTPGPMGGPMGPPPHMGHPPLGPGMGPPPGMPPHQSVMGGPPSGPPPPYGNPHMHMHHREMDMRDRDHDVDDGRDKDDHDPMDSRDRNRDRDRDRDRSRSSKPDRSREKSHRRERSRSRSRRHKSRSRSPSSRHRSKKKSSHRKDKEDSD